VRLRSYAFAALVLVWIGHITFVGGCRIASKAVHQLSLCGVGAGLASHWVFLP
jgi:hypothetical protein